MTDFTTRPDRAHAPYEPPAGGVERVARDAESYERRMEAARTALLSGDRAAAGHALEGAIALAERNSDGAALLAAALTRLGEIRHLDGKERDAEQLFRRALEINERLLGPEHSDLVVLLNDLSRLYLRRGAHADAEPLLLRLHSIKRAKGEDHPEVATVLASLASVRQALGRYDGAEQLWRRVLEIRERTLAPHHFSVATALEHLGDTCAARGKLNEALRHRLRALAMREMTLEPGHPSLRAARERIADLQLQASEEVLDVDVPDATIPPPRWTAMSAPAVAMPVTEFPVPAESRAAASRTDRMPATTLPVSFGDEDLTDDDPARRDFAETRGLQLVNVAGAGDASRSMILPYYADALALADEAAQPDGPDGRQAGRMFTAVAFLRRRQGAMLAVAGAVVLVLGAIGAQSFARTPDDQRLAGEGGFRAAVASTAIPGSSVAVADSATASGVVDSTFGTGEHAPAGATDSPGTPDEIPVLEIAAGPARAFSSPAQAAAPPPPAAAPPSAIDVKVDQVTRTEAAGTREMLAARVALPTGAGLRSIATTGASESQPALLISAPTPVYPVSLYTRSVAGFADVEFAVDTTGRVDLSSFRSRSSHELFTEAVRHTLRDMRFVPAMRNGRRVRAPMRMRFEFSESGVSASRSN